LRQHIPDLKHITITAKADRKIEGAVIIGFRWKGYFEHEIRGSASSEKFWIEKLSLGKFVRFCPTKRLATARYEAIKRSRLNVILAVNETDIYVDRVRTNSPPPHEGMYTHSLGALGRGINLAEYDTFIVDAEIRRPHHAYGADDPFTERLLDQAVTIIQNEGRGLRKVDDEDRRTKLFIIEHMKLERDFQYIVAEIQKMVKHPVQALFVEMWADKDHVCELINKSRETGTIPEFHVVNIDDLVREITEGARRGEQRKPINERIRWSKIVRSLDEDTISRLNALYREERDRTNASAVNRERAEKKIVALLAKGKTKGKIRSDMKIKSWPPELQRWFEQTADDWLRNKSTIAETDDVQKR
jgi:hypothetical protein